MPSLASNGRASFATYSALLALEDLSGRALEGKKAIRDGWNAWDASENPIPAQLATVGCCHTVSHCDSVTSIGEHNVMSSGVLTSWISADATRQQKEAHASTCLWIAVRYWEIQTNRHQDMLNESKSGGAAGVRVGYPNNVWVGTDNNRRNTGQ